MKIWRQGKKIFVDQTDYLHKVVERFGMSNAQGAQIPLPGNTVPTELNGQADPDSLPLHVALVGLCIHTPVLPNYNPLRCC